MNGGCTYGAERHRTGVRNESGDRNAIEAGNGPIAFFGVGFAVGTANPPFNERCAVRGDCDGEVDAVYATDFTPAEPVCFFLGVTIVAPYVAAAAAVTDPNVAVAVMADEPNCKAFGVAVFGAERDRCLEDDADDDADDNSDDMCDGVGCADVNLNAPTGDVSGDEVSLLLGAVPDRVAAPTPAPPLRNTPPLFV